MLLAEETAHQLRRHPAGARGWRNFTSVWLSDAEVRVDVGGEQHDIRADRSGIIDEIIPVTLSPGWQSIGLSSEGSEPAKAWIYVVDPQIRFGVVSDIDDTVMVTALPRPLLAAWHTFVVNEHARATTPGMPVLYERLVTRKDERADHLPLHRGLERGADPDPIPVPQPLPGGCAAAHRLGPDGRPLVPERTRAQARRAGATGARVPGHQVAADR